MKYFWCKQDKLLWCLKWYTW